MAKRLLLVGTSHDYQIPGNAGANDFQAVLENLSREHSVRAIAEEHSLDALRMANALETICKKVARRLGLQHAYCDPGIEDRKSLGVQQENDIKMRKFHDRSIDFQNELRISHLKREQFWMDRVCELNCWPLLFVCGANHIESFSTLSRKQGAVVLIVENDWSPANSGSPCAS
jgi:hypothetical protein